MDAQQPSRWRWAWFCPRCGVHNLAAAEACEGCGLDHALIGAPGATVLHSCGVAAPGWAAYCIGCGAALRAHALPVRGSAEALSLLEVLHRLLAGQAAAQSPAWALRVERVEAAPNGSQGRWLVVRLALRNNG